MTEPRTAIVTGSSKRVGRAIAESLLRDGWTVLAHVHDAGDPVPQGAVKAVADLRDPSCADAIFAASVGLAPVRLLINNAARFAWDGFGEFSADEFDAHMAVNLRAPALLIDQFARRHTSGDALIINILDAKLSAPNPDYLSYTLSKGGLATLTELAARALAPQGIRVNGIAPALMLQSSGQTAENFDRMHRSNPLGRGVDPAHVADAIRFLVEAPTTTGQTITIDSGHRFLGLGRDVQFLEAE
ncbi:SDR family oxidoreductase [Sphingomonas flavescens]|uniref:SDR family oxidoreductase n=1 Tax=Sphingomonas flavescens TaxID=3132797 RepID=UPI00280388E4|nr:SDR family oxidoreductase [Sphingomonas limnosediminicola]